MMLTGVLFLISCATGSGSSGGKRPGWVDDKHSVYPDETYLVEIGEGSSLKKAKQDGLAALSQIFRTTIKVDSTVRTRYKDLSDGENILSAEMETTADETITQLSDETLVNVHFGESWTSEMGRVYVVAYIDRMETANIYRQRIDQDGARADYFIRKSGEQSDLLRRYGFLDAAVVMDQNTKMMLDQLDIIYSPFRRAVMLPYTPENLYSLYADTAEQMLFSINVEGDSDSKITDMVSQVLTGRGFSVTGSGGSLTVTGRVSVEDVTLENDYENVRWFLFMEMRNESGEVVVSMEEKKRESGVSREEAVARGYRTMETMMQKKFIGEMERYFDSFVGN